MQSLTIEVDDKARQNPVTLDFVGILVSLELRFISDFNQLDLLDNGRHIAYQAISASFIGRRASDLHNIPIVVGEGYIQKLQIRCTTLSRVTVHYYPPSLRY